VDAETVRALARLQGITIDEAHVEPLVAALAGHLAAIAALDEYYDVSETEPALTFDPLWR
jgi:hypothetical protein